jgi:MFS family permease
MHSLEKRATFSLATLFSLRMLGLFMILPAFAQTLPGSSPFLIGLALGIYGLTQALFQLPFGMLSDYYSRKNVIFLGFSIFIVGSIIAALSHSLTGIIIGRALQGMGAVGSTIIALLSDLTRPEKRAKSMAIIGMIIGFAFFMALLLGPILNHFISIRGIFWLSAGLGCLAILLNYLWVPTPTHEINTKPPKHFIKNIKLLLTHPTLVELDIGIFLLHAILTATFVVVPLYVHSPWIYAPALLLSVFFTFKFMHYIRTAVFGLIIAELVLWAFHTNSYLLIFGLFLFFTAFNILEANLPSLVSRTAPPELKGTAIGLYSTCQYLGIFTGGILGGFVYGHFSASSVLLLCTFLGLLWIAKSRNLVKNVNS